MKCNRRLIDPANTGDDAVAAPRFTKGNQFSQKLRPHSVAFAIRADVDGILNGKAIAFARAEGRGVAVSHNIAFEFGYQIRQAVIQYDLQSALHCGLTRGDKVEGGR